MTDWQADFQTHSWVWDQHKRISHVWLSRSEFPAHTLRQEATQIMGREPKTRHGDVLGIAHVTPPEQHEDGRQLLPAQVTIEAFYGAVVPAEIKSHIQGMFPEAMIRQAHVKYTFGEIPVVLDPDQPEGTWKIVDTGKLAADWAQENLPGGHGSPSLVISSTMSPGARPWWRKLLGGRKEPWTADDGWTKEADADMEGAMVALYPSIDVCEELKVRGGEDPGNMHITLIYFEDKAEERDDWDNALTILGVIADEHEVLEGRVGGFGVFKNADTGEDDVLWATIDVPGLAEFKHEVTRSLEVAGFDANKEHGFTPHITLKYDWPRHKAVPHITDPIKLRFEMVSLTQGDKQQFVSFKEPDAKE